MPLGCIGEPHQPRDLTAAITFVLLYTVVGGSAVLRNCLNIRAKYSQSSILTVKFVTNYSYFSQIYNCTNTQIRKSTTFQTHMMNSCFSPVHKYSLEYINTRGDMEEGNTAVFGAQFTSLPEYRIHDCWMEPLQMPKTVCLHGLPQSESNIHK